MNRILSGALALVLTLSPIAAFAHDVVTLGALEISGAFSRATLPNAPVGAGYLTITNTGTADDTLVSATSPVAGVTQIHEMKMEGDVMKMNEVEGGLVIPAGQSVTLEPGGFHIMFMELKQAFVEGSMVPVTLTFANAGTVEVELMVGPINADEPSHDMSGM
jgi:copper(I)-binding protein